MPGILAASSPSRIRSESSDQFKHAVVGQGLIGRRVHPERYDILG
jgi:hypothetical protein